MKIKVAIILVVLALFAGGVFLFVERGQHPERSNSGSAMTPSSPENVENQPIQTGGAPVAGANNASAVGSLLLNVESGQELHRRLSGNDFTRGEEAHFRLAISQLCTVMPRSNLAPENPEPAKKLSDETLSAFRASFCAGIGNGEDELSAFDSLDADDKVDLAHELSSLVADRAERPEDARAAVDQLAAMMLSQNAGAESLVAAQTLEQLGYVAPAVEAMARDRGLQLSPGDLAAAQTLSSQLALCSRYGGCGPGQAITMQQCSFDANCAPSRTALDVWRSRYSPAVLEAAQAIEDVRGMERHKRS